MTEIPREFPLPLDVFERQRSLLGAHVETGRRGALQGHRRRRLVVLAAAALVVAVASTSALGTVRDVLFGARRSAPLWASAPAWSPDGQRITFVTIACAPDPTPGCGDRVELNIMNADGSGQRNLTREWGLEGSLGWLFNGSPAWSPDWRTLAFVQERGVSRAYARYSDIYVVDADGSGRRRLMRSPQNDGDPVWSPDGRRLAFVRIRGRRADIYVVNADGSGLRRLAHAIAFTPMPGVPSPGFAANPAWSPDGRKLAFRSNRDGNVDIFVVNADGSGLRNLTRSPRGNDGKRIWRFSPDGGPMWSPDGRQIAFRSERDRPSERAACRPRCRRDEIYVVNADGSGLRGLTRNWKSDGTPVWSPDGRKILFVRSGWFSANVQGDVWVMNADGSGQRNLTRSGTHPFATETAPAWSPDGRKILFVSNRDRNGEIYVMNADGRGERKLTDLKGQD